MESLQIDSVQFAFASHSIDFNVRTLTATLHANAELSSDEQSINTSVYTDRISVNARDVTSEYRSD